MSGRGVLILGPSGSGKSSLALALLALGGRLVADDRVMLMREGQRIMARAPAPIAGLIESRGVGLIRVPHAPAEITLVVDLGQTAAERLPTPRHIDVLDRSLPLVLGPLSAHLPNSIALLLSGGRIVSGDDDQPDCE
ncbi:HPr kinase/phosphorylase [Paracoccus isoporae]|uniref:HPr kinase/phosphorylase n=1 Tax=Paracoccus isoporae TaxID=591205 RepID=A0A1G6SJW1_9RHOB|nr:HPr kinase/phosphorylase [Paracoccus isoporae]